MFSKYFHRIALTIGWAEISGFVMLRILEIEPSKAFLGLLLQSCGVFLLVVACEDITHGFVTKWGSAISRAEHPFTFWFAVLLRTVLAGALLIIFGIYLALS